MRFEIVGKNVEITEAMRSQIEEKLTGLEKYLLVDGNTVARVVARVYPNSQKVEITIPTKVGIVRAEVIQDDFYAALDLAMDKLEDQIRRQKTRLSKQKLLLMKPFMRKKMKFLFEQKLCKQIRCHWMKQSFKWNCWVIVSMFIQMRKPIRKQLFISVI